MFGYRTGYGSGQQRGYLAQHPSTPSMQFTQGGGESQDSYEITLPANPTHPALQLVVVRTGASTTSLDMSADGFTEIATRDGTGRSSIFARLSAVNADTSVDVALGDSRHIGWVAVNIYEFASGLLADVVDAAFPDSNTLDPPELVTAWQHTPITIASTRRADNALTAPDGYTLRASGQSGDPGDTTGHARVSIATQTTPAPSTTTNPDTWGETGNTANVHSATIAIRI